ncbi:MAG: hypothetical protein WB523_18840 [Candidatus Sulfotelmatobacter sp.]
MHSAGSNGSIPSPASDFGDVLVVPSTGTRKMFDNTANNLLELGFGFYNLAMGSFLVKIGEIGVSHGVATDFEAETAKLS